MSGHPFAKITRKPRMQAWLLKWRRLLLRPLRPNRLKRDSPAPPNLLLLGIDTLRADHLGLHGHEAPVSPNLDRLGARGTVFLDTTAAAPWTLPSFSSALTGVMPGLHGAYLPGELRNMDSQPPRRMNDGIGTLATHLRQQGYHTAAFYSNQFFAFGLAESFAEHHYYNMAAEDLAAVAREWIRTHADGPFFCFVLFNDPHEPTTPSRGDLQPFLKREPGADLESLARWGSDPHLGQLENPQSPEARDTLATKLAVYAATIHQVDGVIGNLQEQLERWNLADHTVVSVFADHGEEFLDHHGFSQRWKHDPRPIHGIGHGHTHFQELLHVPWLSWGPGVPSGECRREATSLCDLTPTLLDWMGLSALEQPAVRARLSEIPAELALCLTGHSQANGASGTTEYGERVILAEAIAFGPDLVMVRRGRWKLIAHRDGRPLALFDLLGEPEEKQDLQDANPEVIAVFQEFLRVWRESGTGAGGADANTGNWDDMDDTIRSRLKDLGYSD